VDPAPNCCTNIVMPTPERVNGVPTVVGDPLPAGFVYVRWVCWSQRAIACVNGCCSPFDVTVTVTNGPGSVVYGSPSNFQRCAWVQVPEGECATHSVEVVFVGRTEVSPGVPGAEYTCRRTASYSDPLCPP
jgi:hypothetical protein